MKDYLAQCKEIVNSRTIRSAFDHAMGEMFELDEALIISENGGDSDEDGVVGEATDVILCMLDIISQYSPELNMEQLEEIYFKRKMQKWKDKYGQI